MVKQRGLGQSVVAGPAQQAERTASSSVSVNWLMASSLSRIIMFW